MRISYDRSGDAAYIRVVDPVGAGASVKQVVVPSDAQEGAQFILDFDADGSLLGVEVLGASQGMRAESLASAHQL